MDKNWFVKSKIFRFDFGLSSKLISTSLINNITDLFGLVPTIDK